MTALELLSGDARTFLDKVWASRVHHHRTEPEALTRLLSLDDVDHLLTATAIRTPSVRLARDGAVLPEPSYTRGATLAGKPLTGLVDGRKVLRLFDEGATVVLQGLHRYWPPLTELVAELELELGHPCQANAYLTPPSAQGFAVHTDTHDVFVFQTHGSKLWEIQDPHTEGPGPVEVQLVPGLVVYLPTGTPHAARAQETVSLHVTLGINQLTWRTLLESALRGVLDGADAHLPAGYLDDPGALADGLRARLDQLVAEVRRVDAAAVADRQVTDFLRTRNPRLRGGLVDLVAARGLDDHTRLRRRPGHPCVIREEGQRLRLLLGDRELGMPAWVRPAVEALRAEAAFTPADLPLDPESRLVLCRRLLREGLLETVPEDRLRDQRR